ncbi:MAG: hypothetical protein SGARI_000681 [Bacillariaceae sp.]
MHTPESSRKRGLAYDGDDENMSTRKRRRDGDDVSSAKKMQKINLKMHDGSVVTLKGPMPSQRHAPTTPSQPPASAPQSAPRKLALITKEWQEFVGITPPPRKDSVLPYSVLATHERMRDDGLDGFIPREGSKVTTENEMIVHFLYGSGDFLRQQKRERLEVVAGIFADQESTKRMMAILSKESDTSHCSDNFGTWKGLQSIVFLYEKQHGTITIFRDRKIPIVLRVQSSRNCFQIAPAGVVGYKVGHGAQDNNWEIQAIDAARHARRTMKFEDIRSRVVENGGGKSRKFMKRMVQGSGLQEEDSRGHITVRSKPKSILKDVERFGPALLSGFVTDDMFRAQDGRDNLRDGKYYIPQFDRVDGKDECKEYCLGPMTAAAEEELNEVTRRVLEQVQESNRESVKGLSHSVSRSESEEDMDDDDSDDNSCDNSDDTEDDWDNDTIDDSANTWQHEMVRPHGRHAMILIGGRKEKVRGKRKYWFLIQNSHRRLPLFEVSSEYLAHHMVPPSGTNGLITFLSGNAGSTDVLPKLKGGVCLETDDGYEFVGDDTDDGEDSCYYDSDSDSDYEGYSDSDFEG